MKKDNTIPKLTLVGAGPGDVELITVKGLKAIKQADVILYDALVNEELLHFAPENALKIYVGKRKGYKAYTQEQINQLIVDYALQYGHVVRVKGGDSFVFGRGLEEIQYAEAFGVEAVVIPGISSSIAVPELAGIPVTHRGISNSFWVLTGTLADGSLNPEISNAVQSSATIVILMGLSKLEEIAALYHACGRAEEAVAVISNGSLPTEDSVVGTMRNISQITRERNIKTPAVIVVGKVVEQSRSSVRELYALLEN